jgi:hypothetical protein
MLSVVPNVDLDTAGHPWDARFHAKSKKKIQDGTWRRKKGVPQDEVVAAFAREGVLVASLGVVPPTPPLAPLPPPPGAVVGASSATFKDVTEAFNSRSQKYTHAELQAALRANWIEPTTLYEPGVEVSESYARAIQVLNSVCPM